MWLSETYVFDCEFNWRLQKIHTYRYYIWYTIFVETIVDVAGPAKWWCGFHCVDHNTWLARWRRFILWIYPERVAVVTGFRFNARSVQRVDVEPLLFCVLRWCSHSACGWSVLKPKISLTYIWCKNGHPIWLNQKMLWVLSHIAGLLGGNHQPWFELPLSHTQSVVVLPSPL